MSRATVAAWSPALVQCSWRCRSPWVGSVHAATSPTAHTPGSPSTRPVGPQGRPPGRRPRAGAPSTHPSRGTPPIPTTTTPPSPATRPPAPPRAARPVARAAAPAPLCASPVSALPVTKPSIRTSVRRSTPASVISRPVSAPSSSPSARAEGTGSASSTVTARPRVRARAGHLGADEAAADDQERARALERRAQGQRVVQSPQRVHARGLPGQRAGGQAGGDHDRVRVQRRPVGELHLARSQRHRAHAEMGAHAQARRGPPPSAASCARGPIRP